MCDLNHKLESDFFALYVPIHCPEPVSLTPKSCPESKVQPPESIDFLFPLAPRKASGDSVIVPIIPLFLLASPAIYAKPNRVCNLIYDLFLANHLSSILIPVISPVDDKSNLFDNLFVFER